MKGNLLKGIIFISAVALSSCSVTNKLASLPDLGDDVYHTKAIAGDNIEYADAVPYQQKQRQYNPDDDYYYYGDYTSRINRFAYFTPFDYDDDFYYSYVPYNNYGSYNNLNNFAYSPVNSSAYDFGVYSPFDYGYVDIGGYDNFSYGSLYSASLFSGRRYYGRHSNKIYTTGGSVGGGGSGSGLTFTRANSGYTRGAQNVANSGLRGFNGHNGTTIVYPGRPANGVVARSVNSAGTVRSVRSDNTRPASQQVVERAPTQSVAPANTSSSSNSSSSTTSSGGGGRPVRP